MSNTPEKGEFYPLDARIVPTGKGYEWVPTHTGQDIPGLARFSTYQGAIEAALGWRLCSSTIAALYADEVKAPEPRHLRVAGGTGWTREELLLWKAARKS